MFRKASYVLVFLGSVGLFFATCSPATVGDGDVNGNGKGGGGSSGTNGGKGGNGTGELGGSGGGFSPLFDDAGIPSDAMTQGGPGGENPQDTLIDCGFDSFNVERIPPNVLVVLDRSGSMMRNVSGNVSADPAMSRWFIAETAINTITSSTQADISWGMKMFPTCRNPGAGKHPWRCNDGDGNHNPCAIDGMETLPALGRSSAIQAALAAARPVIDSGATPTALGIKSAVATLRGIKDNRPKFILLVTDGGPNCGVYTGSNCKVDFNQSGCTMCGSTQCNFALPSPNRCTEVSPVTNQSFCAANAPCDRIQGCDTGDNSVSEIQAAVAAGIPVFVLGFAIPDPSATNLAHLTLNRMAMAGGRPFAGAGQYQYYDADDQASLMKALSEIAASTVSCTFALEDPPADDAVAFVTVDERTLPNNPQDGWSFGPGRNSIIFNGTACSRLKAGDFKKTKITFGCPQKLPEPPPIVE